MLTPPKSSRTALKNLLVIVAVTIGFVIYSYGWTITDIDLAKPQEPTRQESLSRAMRELLSPNLFDQKTETIIYGADFRFNCEGGDIPAPNTASTDGTPTLILAETCGDANQRVAFSIGGLPAGARAAIRWVNLEGEGRPRDVFVTDNPDDDDGRGDFFINTDGTYQGFIEVPRMVGTDGQQHTVQIGIVTPIGDPYPSDTLNEVLRRMVETIFMALMATTISIPISVGISFLAAHNLMKPIKMPLGSAMLWAAFLPVGYVFGAWLLNGVARFAFDLGSGQIFVAPAIIVLGMAFSATSKTKFEVNESSPFNGMAGRIGLRVIVMVILAMLIGFIGGFGMTGERGLTDLATIIAPEGFNIFAWSLNSIGRMIGILGYLVDLGLPMITGFIGAFMLPGLVSDLAKPVLRTATGVLNHGIGAVLGAISGAFVMAGIGFIAMTAALVGLLPPLGAALLGQSATNGAVNFFFPPRPAYQTTALEKFLRTIAGWAGGIGAFLITFNLLNVGRTLIDGTLPPLEESLLLGIVIPTYVAKAMLVGLILGGIAGGFAGVRGTFAIGDTLYNLTRNILNALRSIEPLIMALIFVVWVGIGPFAGVLALTLHSIASLGKLYSEQIETIDNGPIEALQSTGANHLQTIIYAVVPQIVPPYIAFTMYRWDINVRMSTIIGFVGGGGIGLLLNQYINLLRYSDAGVAVLAIAIVVAILDFASASIRERIL